MTRSTSVAAWQAMVDSGELEGRIAVVLRAVIDHGPGTSAEVFRAAGIAGNINLHRARLSELQERDMVRETTQRKCAVTGRVALVWEYTGREKPVHVPRRRGKAKAIALIARAAIKALEMRGDGIAKTLGDEFKALGGRL